ncbi:5-demethoxyubiquinol-8 5-hydroxylase UbiM [Sphingomonas sp. MMS12-HWE2-04]|uniref:5-demethoxyubiquinol-8 5-hydroxylase UbiM n=1 Tax=Sphingomonas sp. MMS12-HWE2-04 TaxID=3234199 RepID=UPI00384E4CB2
MNYDVVVVGGGPAGLAFARSLAASGLRLAVVEREPRDALADPPCDGREIALTHRSVATLQRLGAWERLAPGDIAPLRAARVLNGGSHFALAFDAQGQGDEKLGHLVSNQAIRRTLFAAIQDQAGLDILSGTGVATVQTTRKRAEITLADGRLLTARLLVAADSRFSAVREQLGIEARIDRLGRSMLVCRVSHERDHGGVATEWFEHGHTIAMLPLVGHQSSAVLTLPSDAVRRLADLDADLLGVELTRRYGARLGAMRVTEGPHVYPLATSWAEHFAATRAALIGDAAVGMHPVTAHGFNLGLQGQATLARLIAEAAARGGNIAAPLLLRRYEAAHRMAARPLFTATNLLVALYTDERPAARVARHAVLRLGAQLPQVRHGVSRLLMQH